MTRGGGKSIKIDNRYSEAYGPHEVMLNLDGINIYTKTMITCDDDLEGQISVAREELKVRAIGNCAMLEQDVMHLGMGAEIFVQKGLLNTGAVLSVILKKTRRRMGFDKDGLKDSRIWLSAANREAEHQ